MAPSNKLALAKRRTILMRLVSEDNDITYDQLAQEMRQDPWVASHWPDYSTNMAKSDFRHGMALVEDDMRRMALIYLADQLETIDEVQEILMGFANDEELKEGVRIMAINAMGPFVDKQIRIFGNYAANKVQIDKRSLSVNLDTFHEMLESANSSLGELSAPIISLPGEVEEESD